MKNIKGLAVATVAIGMMLGTSAFADSRHHDGTNNDRGGRSRSEGSRSSGQSYQRQDSGRSQQQAARGEQAQTWRGSQQGRIGRDQQQTWDRGQQRQYDRQQGAVEQYRDRGSRDQQYRDRGNNQQYRDRGSVQSYGRYGRNDGHEQAYGAYGRGNRSYGSYGSYNRYGRSSMFREGRVERIRHERGGYRVWLGGFGFPFWIPEARWASWPLRVGLSIRLGGWWDPVGYYDVYDVGPMGGYYNTAGNVHGVVESVDYRRGTVVLRDDVSNSFVTIALRGSDPRLGDLRPGDYVDLAGQWTRGGIFEAYSLQAMRDGGPNDGYNDPRYNDPRY